MTCPFCTNVINLSCAVSKSLPLGGEGGPRSGSEEVSTLR